MTLQFTRRFDLRMLLWATPAFTVLLFAIAVGCQSEPQVIVIDRTVEVIREVEVVKEVVVERVVVVTATPVPTPTASRSAPTAQPAAMSIPTTVAKNRSILLVRNWNTDDFTQLGSLGFSEGISVKIVAGKTRWSNQTGRPPKDISFNKHRSMMVVGEPNSILLDEVRTFVSSGGNAVLLINRCKAYDQDIEYLQQELQFAFGVSCAESSVSYPIRGRGDRFLPFWDGLVLSSPEHTSVEFVPGPSGDFECIGKVQVEIGTLCTALHGVVGNGNVLFIANPHMTWASTFGDEYIHLRDNRKAASRLLNWLVEAPSTRTSPTDSFDAASVLARFSTSDRVEGEARADAVGEIITQHQSGNADSARVLDLLHTVAPELSIEERRRAADELARLSEDGEWDEDETAAGVFYLASLITGDEPNPGERIEAAHEMVALYEARDLDAGAALGLMDTIAPSLSINERRQAAATLAKLSAEGNWNDADRMAAASEVFRLVTGVPLNAEERMGAAVDLAGVGAKIFDTDDQFDDRDIDAATAIIKQSLTGELTAESVQSNLGSGN